MDQCILCEVLMNKLCSLLRREHIKFGRNQFDLFKVRYPFYATTCQAVRRTSHFSYSVRSGIVLVLRELTLSPLFPHIIQPIVMDNFRLSQNWWRTRRWRSPWRTFPIRIPILSKKLLPKRIGPLYLASLLILFLLGFTFFFLSFTFGFLILVVPRITQSRHLFPFFLFRSCAAASAGGRRTATPQNTLQLPSSRIVVRVLPLSDLSIPFGTGRHCLPVLALRIIQIETDRFPMSGGGRRRPTGRNRRFLRRRFLRSERDRVRARSVHRNVGFRGRQWRQATTALCFDASTGGRGRRRG